MIAATNVKKHFGEIAAVNDITVTIKNGEVFGLIGTNGAGKSTFLRMAGGVLKPDAGTILVDERSVYESPKVKAGILQFFLPFVVHVLICAGITVGKDAFTIETIPSMMGYIELHLIIFVLTYSVIVMTMGLTGNIITSILGSVVLFLYSAIIVVLANLLSDRFFDTYILYGDWIDGWFSEKIWCFDMTWQVMIPMCLQMPRFKAVPYRFSS